MTKIFMRLVAMLAVGCVSLWAKAGTDLDLFATDNDGAVWSASWEASRGWDPWLLVHNEVKMQPGATVTALWRSNETHLDLFATGNDGAVWSASWEASRGWWPWFLVHNEVKMQPGATVTALWRSNETHLDLFATGNDGAVWSASWEASRGWWPWFLVHNEVKMQPGATVTALWRSNETHLDLFATGNDGAVWSASWEASRGWWPWFLVHNEVKMQPGATVTALWRSDETHLDLFATGNDGAVWSASWEASRGWWPWFLVHNEVKMQPGATVTALWRSNETHLDLFATGNDGAVWSASWEASRGWWPWFLVHNEVKMQPGATVTALWRSNETHLDLLATGNDGAVWSASWEASRGWWPWFLVNNEVKMQPGATVTALWGQGPNYNVTTQHNNNFRDGTYLVEGNLNPINVQSGFGLLYSREVEGAIYAQPLYAHGVKTSAGTKNLFFIATETNMVYAFDADDTSTGASPIFSRRLQATDYPNAVCGNNQGQVCCETPSGVVGITGTPVIDATANIMYVVARNSSDARHYLHKLDITNNFNDLATPVAIGGTDPSGVAFNGECERQRPGLLLNNGIVYAAFGTYSCDSGCPDGSPYHGWVFGYDAGSLSLAAIFCTSCANSNLQAGIWQTGGGLVSDGQNIYLETGNGAPPLGDSFLKLQITSSYPGLQLSGSPYTPVNAATLNLGDTDLGSGGPVLIANGLLVGGGKQGRYYVINNSNMTLAQDSAPPGGFDGFQAFTNTYHNDSTQTVCSAATGSAGCNAPSGTTCYVPPSQYGNGEICGPNIHGTPVFWPYANSTSGYVYQMPEKDYVKAFLFDNSTQHLQENPAIIGTFKPPDGMPGGFSSLSANFGINGILWTSYALADAQWAPPQPGRLVAFDALTLQEIWHDDGGYLFAKSVPPTIAEGKVFRATASGEVVVYGLQGNAPQGSRIAKEKLVVDAKALAVVYKRSGGKYGLLGNPQGKPRRLNDGGWSQDFRSKLPIHGYTAVSVHPNMHAMDVSCSHALPLGAYSEVESSVYWTPKTGAHIVTGEIRRFWLKTGGPRGRLGYPVSDEMPSQDGLGRASQFEHGVVTWHFDKGAAITNQR